MYDILIIGSGPAGLTAAIYAKRANKNTVLIEGNETFGQIIKTLYVENYPGFSVPISGFKLIQEMYQQAKNLGVHFIEDFVTDFFEEIENITKSVINPIDNTKTKENLNNNNFKKNINNYILKDNNFFRIILNKQEILSKSIIICSGSYPKLLGIEGNLLGNGISTCATCDGYFFKNQNVAIIGGGNSAVEEALYLANIAKKVYLIHRRTQFKADSIIIDKLTKYSNIEILTPYTTQKFIENENKLVKIIIKNNETNETKEIQINGAFIAIGQNPNTKFLNKKLILTESNHIKNFPITEIPGIFAAGDVADSKYKQAITAAGFGCMAAIEAIKYLDSL